MSKELVFDGWWEGQAEYSCDECHKTEYFLFSDEEDAKNSRKHRKSLKEDYGWIFTKVDGEYKDFCSEACRNKYIRKNTI